MAAGKWLWLFLKSKMNPLTLAPGASAGVLANPHELLFIRARRAKQRQ